MVHMNVASTGVPGLVWPGAMNATFVVRSGAAAGWFVLASMNENTNRYGPTTWLPMITGMTDGPPDGLGTVDGLAVAGFVAPHAAATRATAATNSRVRRMGDRDMGGA